MVPLLVRARLAAGIAHAAPWGIALDGLLAAQLWAERKEQLLAAGEYAERALQAADPPDLDLPVAKCTAAGHDQWHWAATCAYPRDADPQVRVNTWTGRLDRRDLEQVATGLPKVVSERQGRFRARCMPLLVTACTSVEWHAIGDPARIRALVEPVTTIGKKRTIGEGQVVGWDILEAPELDAFTAAHLHPDGSLGRPTPAACLPPQWAGDDGGTGMAGIRPPYMHRSRRHEVHLPALITAA